jgi:MOSC domain-containing protein YiiM
MSAKVVSVNVSYPRTVDWNGQKVRTGIFKTPVPGRVRAVGANLEGDEQADRTVHGGVDKAVYAFPVDHYPQWQARFPDAVWGFGALGENLTLEGLFEDDVYIGDRYRCGSAELIATQPRMPCFKLGIRVGDPGALGFMLETGNTGFYLAIAEAGEFAAGDTLERHQRPHGAVPISLLTQLYVSKHRDPELLRRVVEAPYVTKGWRTWAVDQLNRRPGVA